MRVVLLCVLSTLPLFGQAPTTDKFPIAIHVTASRMEQSPDLWSNTQGQVYGDGSIWSVMHCEIDGHTYGLRGHRLPIGWYAGRETKHGYEIEFRERGKHMTRKYYIVEQTQ